MTELKLISSMAPRELLKQLTRRFEATNHAIRVHLEAAGGVDVAQRARAGEAVDIVVLARTSIDELVQDGVLTAASICDIAESGIGVAVRSGAEAPDISDEAALRKAVLAARSLSYSTGPSGVYLEKLFASWGALGDLKSRIVVPPPGTPVGSLVGDGRAELGFQQLSELVGVQGISVVGPLPDALQLFTRFSGAVTRVSPHGAAAERCLRYLGAPGHASVKTDLGMRHPGPAQEAR